MADKDSSMVKPVESLQNIGGVTPAKRREQRKRRQNLGKQKEEESEQETNESVQDRQLSGELTVNEDNNRTIDYCA